MLERIYKAHRLMDSACDVYDRTINIMEVCGTHTVSIFRNGIKTTLPEKIKLLSGPGCPVCVTDVAYIDNVLSLARRDDCIVATYGDMLRVPGSDGSLETNQVESNVKVVLSSENALKLAKENQDKTVVFIAVGFETTAPATAVAIKEAAEQNIGNFCVLTGHKKVVPAMKALLANENNNIDAFLCPGHVSAVTGYEIFDEIAKDFHRPCVVAGFEPMQIIEGLAEICRQLAEGKPESKSIYHAVVTRRGNTQAQKLMDDYFDTVDGNWRGFGKIEKSTLQIKPEYEKFDAAKRFDLSSEPKDEPTQCRCGEVLRGLIDPPACRMFGKNCTPDEPVGPCMVSSEGVCAAWFKYDRKNGDS